MNTEIMPQDNMNVNNMTVIGIGASAGGLEAITVLFDNMPNNTGFAFILIQHLSPDHKSLMGELLKKHTRMKVVEAEHNMLVEPDMIYLLPRKKLMTMSKGRLKLDEKLATSLPNNAIDVFFDSLGSDKKSNAVAIVLSATGTDGTKGILSIKKNGGTVVVQDPVTAAFDGMPNSVIATGKADLVLAPEMIADELIEYLNDAGSDDTKKHSEEEERILVNIFNLIKESTTHDFSNYKRPTITRRLAKRMAEKNIQSINKYQELLLEDPAEIKEIAKEFLIGVTSFFRDEEAFEMIRLNVIPELFAGKKSGDLIKIWCVACSTGEEPYSLAILMQEYMDKMNIHSITVKIFATDIDKDALEVASRGHYPPDAVKLIPTEKLQAFFMQEGNIYKVAPAIRKMVVFAFHDILKDPPFSRIDFVSCRNMLIYMNSQLQKKVLKSFHFALNTNGFMMLGPSENAAWLKDSLKEIHKKWKIFQCVSKSKYLEYDGYNKFEPTAFTPFTTPAKSKSVTLHMSDVFKEIILEEYAYAGILIDKDFEVKQAMGNFKKFMQFPEDTFNLNLLKLVQPDLSIPLGVCLRRAVQNDEKMTLKKVKLHGNGSERLVNVIVKPYLKNSEFLQPFIFVILQEEESIQVASRPIVADSGMANDRIMELEGELKETRENLQAVIEEMESTNEELQSSNEEIVSSNEELQSTNEELQSLNEELHTVNAEHQQKIKELIELNDDMNNYFLNSAVGQILIDQNLIIRKFTPIVTRQINVIESDIGRSVVDISTNIKNINLVELIREVMKKGKPKELEVLNVNGGDYLLRITPYIRADKSTDGVVLSFIDITESKQLNSMLQGIFNSSTSGIMALKAVYENNSIVDFEYIASNHAAEKALDVSEGALLGKRLLVSYPDFNKEHFQYFISVMETGENASFEFHNTISGKWYDVVVVKMHDGIVTTFADVTSKKKAADIIEKSYSDLKSTSEKLQETNVKLEQSNFDLMQFASVASHDLKEPLRKVQTFGNLLKEKIAGKLEDGEWKYLDKMITAATRMQSLVEDVLTLSKLSNTEIPRIPTNLNNTISKILDDLEITIKERNAIIHVGKLPEVDAVPGQIHQLFQNLISNALKFNEGTPELDIIQRDPKEFAKTYGIEANDYVIVSVRDNGIGFDQKFSEKIFGVFQRLHSSSFQGTGIGLAICKKIVENHHGFITVDSMPGKGSSFNVILPKRMQN